jgi:hypothetical protein
MPVAADAGPSFSDAAAGPRTIRATLAGRLFQFGYVEQVTALAALAAGREDLACKEIER